MRILNLLKLRKGEALILVLAPVSEQLDKNLRPLILKFFRTFKIPHKVVGRYHDIIVPYGPYKGEI